MCNDVIHNKVIPPQTLALKELVFIIDHNLA
jgi:hypothetical protein